MSRVAYLRFGWQPVAPLHTGYSQSLATYTGRIRKGERASINLETHADLDRLQPAFLASSVKGVVRSASAWLLERTAREEGCDGFVTCDYWDSLAERWQRQQERREWRELCLACQVFGGSGCLPAEAPGGAERPALRRQSAASFHFSDLDDAYHAETRDSPGYIFAWQVVEQKGRELRVEQLQPPAPPVILEVRIEPATDFAVALVLLASDLIGSGLFRFGRFASRGYGLVRLPLQSYFYGTLSDLLGGNEEAQELLPGQVGGRQAAKHILAEDPLQIVAHAVRQWLQHL